MRTGTHHFPKNVASVERSGQINYLNKIDESYGENNKAAKHVNCTKDKHLVSGLQYSNPDGSAGSGIAEYPKVRGTTNTTVINLSSPKFDSKLTKSNVVE